MTVGPFTPLDDRFHFGEMSDRWWITETCWFSFCCPERRLGGWLYIMVRPNIGTLAGGAWVWDDSAALPWEVLYSANYSAMRFPRDQDLTDCQLPTGVAIRMLKPLTTYDLRYRDEELIDINLRFTAIMAPHALGTTSSSLGHLSHFDQFGHVEGTLTLHGNEIGIDCLAMRDRSWGPRPEHRPRRNAYVTGVSRSERGFLAVANPATHEDTVAYGFLLDQGEVRDLVRGSRQVERDPGTGWITKVTIIATDEEGRRFRAEGTPVSRIVLNRHTFIDVNSLVRWEMDDGAIAWGEDQDIWPVHEWSRFRREARTKPPHGPAPRA